MRSGGTVPAAYGLSDASGNFTSHAFVWAGRAWEEVTGVAQVCLATHASTQHLHWIATHAARWSGPISVAIYAAGREYVIAAAMVSYLSLLALICHSPNLVLIFKRLRSLSFITLDIIHVSF